MQVFSFIVRALALFTPTISGTTHTTFNELAFRYSNSNFAGGFSGIKVTIHEQIVHNRIRISQLYHGRGSSTLRVSIIDIDGSVPSYSHFRNYEMYTTLCSYVGIDLYQWSFVLSGHFLAVSSVRVVHNSDSIAELQKRRLLPSFFL